MLCLALVPRLLGPYDYTDEMINPLLRIVEPNPLSAPLMLTGILAPPLMCPKLDPIVSFCIVLSSQLFMCSLPIFLLIP